MIDIGVIGVGNMGKNHARILSSHKMVNSVYIYDKNEHASKKIASDYNCLVSSSLESLFTCVDSVVVATPTQTHYNIAKDCVERGINTLVEKPLCDNPVHSKELCQTVDVYPELVTGVGHIERFNPVVAFIKRNMKEPTYISFTRHNPGSTRVVDVHIVEDLMIHDIDLMNHFTVLNMSHLPISSCGDENTFVSIIDNGFPIILSASRLANKKTRQIYVEDKEYTIVGDLVDQSVNVYHKPETYNFVTEVSYVGRVNLQRIEPLQVELDAFLTCIDRREPFPISFMHGHINMVIASAIKKCHHKNQIIDETVVREIHV